MTAYVRQMNLDADYENIRNRKSLQGEGLSYVGSTKAALSEKSSVRLAHASNLTASFAPARRGKDGKYNHTPGKIASQQTSSPKTLSSSTPTDRSQGLETEGINAFENSASIQLPSERKNPLETPTRTLEDRPATPQAFIAELLRKMASSRPSVNGRVEISLKDILRELDADPPASAGSLCDQPLDTEAKLNISPGVDVIDTEGTVVPLKIVKEESQKVKSPDPPDQSRKSVDTTIDVIQHNQTAERKLLDELKQELQSIKAEITEMGKLSAIQKGIPSERLSKIRLETAHKVRDPAIQIFRRFGRLHDHVLQKLQEQSIIAEVCLDQPEQRVIENKKDKIDPEAAGCSTMMTENLSSDLVLYGQLLLQHRKMQSLAKPSPELRESLNQFLADRGQSATWLRKADDLVDLQPHIGTGWYGIGIVDLVREHCLAEVQLWKDFYDSSFINAASAIMRSIQLVAILCTLPAYILNHSRVRGEPEVFEAVAIATILFTNTLLCSLVTGKPMSYFHFVISFNATVMFLVLHTLFPPN